MSRIALAGVRAESGQMFRMLSDAFRGPAAARTAHRRAQGQGVSLAAAVKCLEGCRSVSSEEDPESPILLLSAGWRSGSTMVQRLLMSDSRVLIWGEPYDECGLIQAMAESMKAFRPGWPPEDYFYKGTSPAELTSEWIANLFPSLEDWRQAHRAMFERLFAHPARQAGAARWGIKEVRLTTGHCAYLRWLFPNAKFVLLYRHPFHAYRSYCRYGRQWYDTFPDRPVLTPTDFGRHWRRLMEGFLRDAPILNAMLVKYEDLISGSASIDELERYLGVSVDRDILQRKVGSSHGSGRTVSVSALEKWLLRRQVYPLAYRLGYVW